MTHCLLDLHFHFTSRTVRSTCPTNWFPTQCFFCKVINLTIFVGNSNLVENIFWCKPQVPRPNYGVTSLHCNNSITALNVGLLHFELHKSVSISITINRNSVRTHNVRLVGPHNLSCVHTIVCTIIGLFNPWIGNSFTIMVYQILKNNILSLSINRHIKGRNITFICTCIGYTAFNCITINQWEHINTWRRNNVAVGCILYCCSTSAVR